MVNCTFHSLTQMMKLVNYKTPYNTQGKTTSKNKNCILFWSLSSAVLVKYGCFHVTTKFSHWNHVSCQWGIKKPSQLFFQSTRTTYHNLHLVLVHKRIQMSSEWVCSLYSFYLQGKSWPEPPFFFTFKQTQPTQRFFPA